MIMGQTAINLMDIYVQPRMASILHMQLIVFLMIIKHVCMIMDSFATILEINFIVTYKMIIIFAYPLILERPAINSNQDGISLMMATFCRELNFYK